MDRVACPFCPLLCDDLSLDIAADGAITVAKNGCGEARKRYAEAAISGTASIAGRKSSRRAAVERAAEILKKSRQPLVSGLAADVDGIRQALLVAEKSGAVVDHAASDSFDAGVRVLQSRGWYLTTLGEVRNRADLVVFVGANVKTRYEQFIRRFVAPAQALAPSRRKQRAIAYLGPDTDAPIAPKNMDATIIDCEMAALPETLNVLRAFIAGNDRLSAPRGGKTTFKRLEHLAAAINGAQYPVFVWAASQLGRHADLVIHSVTRLVDDLNQTARAACLSLGGDAGLMSAANVCTWQTGYPLHVAYGSKTIDYDPNRYRTATLIERKEVDAIVWVDALGQTVMPAVAPGVPIVVLAPPGSPMENRADVFIPIATPGIDQPGRMIRADSVVTVPLDAVRSGNLPSARSVLAELAAHWE